MRSCELSLADVSVIVMAVSVATNLAGALQVFPKVKGACIVAVGPGPGSRAPPAHALASRVAHDLATASAAFRVVGLGGWFPFLYHFANCCPVRAAGSILSSQDRQPASSGEA